MAYGGCNCHGAHKTSHRACQERSRAPRCLLWKVRLVASRADPVGEHSVGALRDVLLQRHPALTFTELPAVEADREQPLQLSHLLLQAEDTLRDEQARPQLVGIEWLGDEVVRSGVERVEIALLGAAR